MSMVVFFCLELKCHTVRSFYHCGESIEMTFASERDVIVCSVMEEMQCARGRGDVRVVI